MCKSMKGINYYHESMGFLPKTLTEVETDIEIIKNSFQSIKVFHNPYSVDSLQYIALIVKVAKKSGLHVVWVENNDNTQFTSSNWTEYVEFVKNDCILANELEVDEFLVGNEISIHNDNSSGYDDTNLPIKIKNLINDCSKFTNAKLSYQEGWWKKDCWNNAGIGQMYKIYFTLYENDADFEKYARELKQKFRDQVVIGEWSTQNTFLNSASDELDWKNKLQKRKKLLDNLHLIHYYFCFRDTGVDSNNKGFGLWKYDKLEPHLAWFIF